MRSWKTSVCLKESGPESKAVPSYTALTPTAPLCWAPPAPPPCEEHLGQKSQHNAGPVLCGLLAQPGHRHPRLHWAGTGLFRHLTVVYLALREVVPGAGQAHSMLTRTCETLTKCTQATENIRTRTTYRTVTQHTVTQHAITHTTHTHIHNTYTKHHATDTYILTQYTQA